MSQMLSIKLKSNSRLRRKPKRLSRLRDGLKLNKNIKSKSSWRANSLRLRRLMKFLIRKRKAEFRLRRISKLSKLRSNLLWVSSAKKKKKRFKFKLSNLLNCNTRRLTTTLNVVIDWLTFNISYHFNTRISRNGSKQKKEVFYWVEGCCGCGGVGKSNGSLYNR